LRPLSRRIRLADLFAAVEGAALYRHILEAPDRFVVERVDALRDFVNTPDQSPISDELTITELDVDAGYEAWAPSYDSFSNALIRAEEPLVAAALGGLEPARALDAACGTGRHTARLVAQGHDTIGVDRSDAMLAIAREKVPSAEIRRGDLTALPLDDGSVDIAVCALALTHLFDPTPAIDELARVVRRGGRVVVSDANPSFVLLQAGAIFPYGEGVAFIRSYSHRHSTYLGAFTGAGLSVVDCREATMEPQFGDGLLAPVATSAAALWRDVPAVLIWVLESQH
jgi:ubiquinone/menaquinone biosynthesis C-methylase UbiE